MTTVLAVDDDLDHRELYPLTLRRYGYRVVTAPDTVTARLALGAGGIDAVLLDVQLPSESGIDLCRYLRLDPVTARLPIMLVSADVSEKRIEAGLAAGANDYLTKPFPRAELVARLGTLLNSANVTAARAARLAAHAARPALTHLAVPHLPASAVA